MNAAPRKPMTQEEFFAWAQAQDNRYEFDGFQPVATTGASGNHGRIASNINVEFRNRLGDGSCEALIADGGIETKGKPVRYPDGVVTCTAFDGRGHLIPNPVVVFEIKPNEYAQVPSIRRYVIVEQTVIGLTVLWRETDEPWRFQTLKGGDTLALPEIGIELPVDSLYARVDLTEP